MILCSHSNISLKKVVYNENKQIKCNNCFRWICLPLLMKQIKRTSKCNRIWPLMDWHDVEVDEPIEWILIHGIDVWQISNRKEQDRRVLCNWLIALARFIDLLLSLFSNLRKAFTIIIIVLLSGFYNIKTVEKIKVINFIIHIIIFAIIITLYLTLLSSSSSNHPSLNHHLSIIYSSFNYNHHLSIEVIELIISNCYHNLHNHSYRHHHLLIQFHSF